MFLTYFVKQGSLLNSEEFTAVWRTDTDKNRKALYTILKGIIKTPRRPYNLSNVHKISQTVKSNTKFANKISTDNPNLDYKHSKHATLTISTIFRAIMAGRNPDRSSINIVDIVRRVVTTMNNLDSTSTNTSTPTNDVPSKNNHSERIRSCNEEVNDSFRLPRNGQPAQRQNGPVRSRNGRFCSIQKSKEKGRRQQGVTYHERCMSSTKSRLGCCPKTTFQTTTCSTKYVC